MVVKVLKPVTHDGKRYLVGEVVEKIDEKQAHRLIRLGAAKLWHSDGTNSVIVDVDTEDNEDLLSDAEVLKLLDENFTLPLLRDEAARLGMDFAGNIAKTKLIAQIIEEGHEEYFLDQIPE